MGKPESLFIEDLSEGQSASLSRVVTDDDIRAFAALSGDINPLHLDDAFAADTMFRGRIAHGFLVASLFSTLFGVHLPGPGAVYISQKLRFRAPVRPGDTVDASCTVLSVDGERSSAVFGCSATVGGKTVLEGEAVLLVPSRKKKRQE